jgi:hypothetical protein
MVCRPSKVVVNCADLVIEVRAQAEPQTPTGGLKPRDPDLLPVGEGSRVTSQHEYRTDRQQEKQKAA